jgi:lipoprotein-releasing system permease protein
MLTPKNKFYFWLASRMLLSKTSQLFSLSGINALVGLILGVASLVVSMAVMSGFESTLQKSVADVSGHLQILIRGQNQLTREELIERIKKVSPDFVAATRFSYLEAVIAHDGKLSGVVLQGLDPDGLKETLGLEKRIVEGKLDIQPTSEDEPIPAVIGLGLARDMKLQVGSEFRVVLPLKDDLNPNQFRRKIGVFKVSGVLDLGKYDYNARMILTSLSTTQKLAEINGRYSGLLVKFKDIEKARDIGVQLTRELGQGFTIRDWHDVNENLFEAVQIERIVIFFVILVIVIAAAFNAASTLYINVVTRYSEIGLLKAMGVSRKGIVQIFSWQGLWIGMLGLLGGMILGLGLCFLFGWVESHYGLLPGSIYKIDRIDLTLRWVDALEISVATLLICFLATLAPALRGAALSPVEGLKNE